MIVAQNEITELYQLWFRLSFTQLLAVNQLHDRFQIEFVLNTEDSMSNLFLSEIQNLTIKKHPAGSVIWTGYWSVGGLNSQYKRYKIDFIDISINEKIDEEKLKLYVTELKECLKRKLPTY